CTQAWVHNTRVMDSQGTLHPLNIFEYYFTFPEQSGMINIRILVQFDYHSWISDPFFNEVEVIWCERGESCNVAKLVKILQVFSFVLLRSTPLVFVQAKESDNEQGAVTLHDSTQKIKLNHHIEILIDHYREYTIEDIISGGLDDQ